MCAPHVLANAYTAPLVGCNELSCYDHVQVDVRVVDGTYYKN